MLSLIVLVGALIYVLFEMYKTVREAVESAKTSFRELKRDAFDQVRHVFDERKRKIVGTVGLGVAAFLLNAVKNKLFPKK